MTVSVRHTNGAGRTLLTQVADAQSLAWAQRALETRQLARIDVPVLAMYGTQTYPQMPAAAASLVAVLPRAEAKQVPGAMHMWEPEPMAVELASFTTRCAAG